MGNFNKIYKIISSYTSYKYIFVLNFLFLYSCGMILSPVISFNNLPKPKGEYFVGTKIYTWIDSTREEWFTSDEHDYRKIVVQAWYPSYSADGELAPYFDQWRKRIGPVAKRIDIPKVLIKSIKNVTTNSYIDSKIAGDKNYPLLIFSHGLGGMRMQNTIQMEYLASNGYIIIAIDHAYDANITIFEDGTIADFRSEHSGELTAQQFWKLRLPQINTRSADISFVLDYIEKLIIGDSSFWSYIDMDKIGVLGHSFGGGTAILSSSKDSRIDACVLLDSWFLPVPSSVLRSGMKIPFLYMGQLEWENKLNYLKLDTLISSSSSVAKKILLPGTKHMDFSDTPQFTKLSQKLGVSGDMSALALRDTLNNSIINFFNKYLNYN